MGNFTVEELKWYVVESLNWLEIYEREGCDYSAMLERNALVCWVKLLEEAQ